MESTMEGQVFGMAEPGCSASLGLHFKTFILQRQKTLMRMAMVAVVCLGCLVGCVENSEVQRAFDLLEMAGIFPREA